jgi:hypothetical protein
VNVGDQDQEARHLLAAARRPWISGSISGIAPS